MPTILLVDDEELSRFALRTLLSRNFDDMMVVAEAESGEEALALYRQHRPDGVLMDIRLPGMNGLEASRRILREYPMASILICSAYDSFALVSEALDIGVKGYLLKPLKRDEAVEKISRLFHANVSTTEAFADQQLLAMLTAKGLSAATREQIQRYYGKLEEGVLLAADIQEPSEEIQKRLSYLLKKRAPSMGYVFAGVLEGLFAALVSPAGNAGEWRNQLLACCQECGMAHVAVRAARVAECGWAEAWQGISREITAERVGEPGSHLLDNIDDYIQDEQLETISLEGLAEDFGVSPQHLSSTFKERVGINFIEYITQRRMQLARRLLMESNLSTAQIAQRCGYADTTYFRKLFSRFFGASPHAFRPQ